VRQGIAKWWADDEVPKLLTSAVGEMEKLFLLPKFDEMIEQAAKPITFTHCKEN
jgi:hypothetical protein